jgi:hypothetical protein
VDVKQQTLIAGLDRSRPRLRPHVLMAGWVLEPVSGLQRGRDTSAWNYFL